VQTEEEEILLQVEKALFNSSDTDDKKTKYLLMLNLTLTAWRCVLLEELIVSQLFTEFYKLITVFTPARH
jgi:hypothetical protein